MNLTLDERLSACADFVRENSILADVGTDHAYLPSQLLQSGKIKSAIAADINEKPLESAKQTIKDCLVEDKVTLKLCSGLDDIYEDEFTDLVIAGMGGELIISILSACPYIKNEKYNLVLQPMSKAYDLRKWLCENGFLIKDEKCAIANKKVYTVINASFCEKGCSKDEMFYYFGKHILKNDEKSKQYVNKIKTSLIKKANGILSSNSDESYAKGILEMLESV